MIQDRTRYLLTGTGAWLLATAALHWLPIPIPFVPKPDLRMAAIAAANAVSFALLAYFVIRRLPPDQRVPACAALVTPGLFGDAVAMAFFGDFFPHIDAQGSNLFAALLFVTYAVILTTGLITAKAAPRASNHR